jgi:hypothetical protein
MTEQEMNDFLQSIGGLKLGYYSDREPIMTAGFFECDSGWYPLIKDLIEDLVELGWDREVCQVKEKFGGLRFYINAASDEMYDRISQAEKESYETCEVTGKPGQLRTDIGWWTTLCEEEYQKILAKRNS